MTANGRWDLIGRLKVNWLVSITETESVYCAVRTGYLNTIYISLWNQSRYANYQINYIYYMEHNTGLF